MSPTGPEFEGGAPARSAEARPVSGAHWHLFCRVVDNYGDAGVCWRLARQLAAEHALDVTLWIDQLATLARFEPAVDTEATTQSLRGVTLRPLTDDADDALPDVVVEGFGCGLPRRFLDAMATAARAPLWINLEYLSAEPWVDSVHGLASPQPRLPLERYFWFPGFTRRTGGLVREAGLIEARAVSASTPEGSDALRITLFCYPNRALPALFDAWSEGDEAIVCTIPEGVATAALDQWLHGDVPHAQQSVTRGRLEIRIVPFGTQDAFDRLLWRSDVNIVRGEDSFVRAQWAGRPFVWQPYPQEADTHRLKLDAFLTRYCADLPSRERDAVGTMSRSFNDEDGTAVADAWPWFRRSIDALAAHGEQWASSLAEQPDLASGLVAFARARL